MNRKQKAIIKSCIKPNSFDELPLFDEILILPTKKVHESGYKIMYVIGCIRETKQNYLLDTWCDVINIGQIYGLMMSKAIKDLNIDILDDGIIRLFSRAQKFKNTFRLSNCVFEVESQKEVER